MKNKIVLASVVGSLFVVGFSYMVSIITDYNFWMVAFMAVAGFNLAVMAYKDFLKSTGKGAKSNTRSTVKEDNSKVERGTE